MHRPSRQEKAATTMNKKRGPQQADPQAEGNIRRAIDFHDGDKIDEAAPTALLRAAVALNISSAARPRPRSAK